MTPVEAAATQREVTLTTIGRKSGKPRRVIIWIVTDGQRLYVRSGQGFRRDWPNNLTERGEAALQLGAQSIKVKPRHVTDPDEACAVSQLVRKKPGLDQILNVAAAARARMPIDSGPDCGTPAAVP